MNPLAIVKLTRYHNRICDFYGNFETKDGSFRPCLTGVQSVLCLTKAGLDEMKHLTLVLRVWENKPHNKCLPFCIKINETPVHKIKGLQIRKGHYRGGRMADVTCNVSKFFSNHRKLGKLLSDYKRHYLYITYEAKSRHWEPPENPTFWLNHW